MSPPSSLLLSVSIFIQCLGGTSRSSPLTCHLTSSSCCGPGGTVCTPVCHQHWVSIWLQYTVLGDDGSLGSRSHSEGKGGAGDRCRSPSGGGSVPSSPSVYNSALLTTSRYPGWAHTSKTIHAVTASSRASSAGGNHHGVLAAGTSLIAVG